jgi:tetratricopeptide (TPR) repeat protein
MPKSKLFWTFMSIFQVVFGLIIFIATRNAYMENPQIAVDGTSEITPFPPTESRPALELSSAMLQSLAQLEPDTPDPVAISLLANEYFEKEQYAEAAELYEQLLTFGPSNSDVHNNLGLTLHYLGRSVEALLKLEEGLALDSTNQRIWLTIGYVNSQTGNVNEAHAALSTAVQMNASSEIGKSAAQMLDDLSQ